MVRNRKYHPRRALVSLLALFAVLLGAVPLGIEGFAPVAPDWLLMIVFYWSIYRPELLPAPVIFLLALLSDAIGGGPPGMSAILLLLVRLACLSQRRAFVGKSLLVTWFGFAAVALGAAVLSWPLASLYYETLIDPHALLARAALTVVLFPLLAWPMVTLQSWIGVDVAVET